MTAGKLFFPLLIIAGFGFSGRSHISAAEVSIEEAWNALPGYENGQDMASLLAIDRAVIEAMAF